MGRRGFGGFRRPEWFERYDRPDEAETKTETDEFEASRAFARDDDDEGEPFAGQAIPEGDPEGFMSWRPRGRRGPWSSWRGEPPFGSPPPWGAPWGAPEAQEWQWQGRPWGGPPGMRRGPWSNPWRQEHHGHHGPHEYGRHGKHGWYGDESFGWFGGPFRKRGPCGPFGGFGRFGRGRPFGPPWAHGGRWGWFPGPRGFGGGGWPSPEGWGPFMGRRFGFGGPGPRMFERGHLKYALLELLQERPKHGYEMMKELEERMGGFYAPSAGAIYPTLQLLEDRGWVSVETVEGKKIYTITDAGRQAVSEYTQRAEQRAQGPQGHHGPHGHQHGPHGHGPHGGPEGPRGPWSWGEWSGPKGPGFGPGFGRGFGPGAWRGQPEAQALAREARDVGRLMLMAGMQSIGQPERLNQLKGIVERARADLEAFLNQTSSSQGSQGSQPSQGSQDAPQRPTEQASDQGGPVETV